MNQKISLISNKLPSLLLAIFLTAGFFILGGCELAYLVAGNGQDKALYNIPQSDRVLVLVDSSAASPMTMEAAADLIDAVNSQLYQNKVADQLVPSFRITALEKTNPVTYRQMGIADIAKAVNADLVVYIFIDRFDVLLDSDQQVSHGDATGLVKVVNSNGDRLWPNDATDGYSVTAQVKENLATNQSAEDVQNQLITQLANNVSQLFYNHPVGYTPSEQETQSQMNSEQ
ncbi:MAG TPA: hypothetical protein VMG59_03830 [Phycisphaerae bacterium]|nr:hypothetical protein [Phycisphaerae bacterium]